MVRGLVVLMVLSVVGSAPQSRNVGRLDKTNAFFVPSWVGEPNRSLAELRGGSIDAELYLRYLAARDGAGRLEDLAFDVVLERECRARGLARVAPALARSLAARRFHESGRARAQDPGGRLQRQFMNDALRRMRVDALVRARIKADEDALRAIFEGRYGPGGRRVRIRHVLVSFDATRRRLLAREERVSAREVDERALARARRLRGEWKGGKAFDQLLAESDDRTTRRQLRDPAHAATAGFLVGYDYQRFGEAFADAVRALAVGEVSKPVRSSIGFHLIELVERIVTRFDDVRAEILEDVDRRQTLPVEERDLRKRLLREYGFKDVR